MKEPKNYIVQQPSASVEEPLGITIFKWSIIIVGSVMLGAALFLYTQVVYICSKGQLISKCPFGVIVLTKIPTKKFTNSDLESKKW